MVDFLVTAPYLSNINTWLTDSLGFPETASLWLLQFAAILAICVVAYIVNLVTKGVLVRIVRGVVARSNTKFGDALLAERFFQRLAHLAPAIVVKVAAPLIFGKTLIGSKTLLGLAEVAVNVYLVTICLFVVDSLLNAGLRIYQGFKISKRVPIKGYLQAVKIIVNAVGVIFILSILFDKSPVYFFSGLGAITAVLLLVFKDAILGLVAGIQLAVNNMVRKGDWIEMPKFGADGDVIDVSLTTIKVQNWDKTITSIPSHSLVTDAFKNWRGMSESGGRRIKRNLSIDVNSIRFVDQALLDRFNKIDLLEDYLDAKIGEIESHNKESKVDEAALVNGRRITNVGTFRAYCVAYLRSNKKIHQEGMTFLVRQLAPTEKGLPIEIYVFTNDVAWANYEAIQADVFDHLFAALNHFDLRAYQLPSGSDLQNLGNELVANERE